MGSLYIKGSQCKHAAMKTYDHWKIFDKNQESMAKLANKFDVFIARETVDEDDNTSHFIVMNKKTQAQCFYEGAAFEYDMSVEQSDTFDSRANDFITALNETQKFSDFHNLDWSHTKVLYFTTS